MDPRLFGDALESQMRDSFLQAVEASLRLVDQDELVRLLVRGNQREIALFVERLLAEGFVPTSAKYVQAMQAAATAAGASVAGVGVGIAGLTGLQRLDPRVLDFVRREGGARITGIGLDAIRAVQEVVAQGVRDGAGAAKIGRDVRGSIGLLPSHGKALARYRGEMEAKVKRGEMRTETAERNVEVYRKRLLAYRADMIARTEAMNAAHGGLVEGWLANMEAGFLDPGALMEWVVTEDDRTCARCVPMDGKRVKVRGGVFEATEKGFPDGVVEWGSSPGSRRKRKGGIKPGTAREEWREVELDGRVVPLAKPIRVGHPPLHPNCRCSLRLVVE